MAKKKAKAIPKELTRHVRPAWAPRVKKGVGALDGSKFAGRALLGEGGAWPGCGHCRAPLRFMLQLAIAELPERERKRLGGKGLIQLFACLANSDCDFSLSEPFSKAAFVRLLKKPPKPAKAPPSLPEGSYPAKQIVGWKELAELPDLFELKEHLKGELSDESEEYLLDHGPSLDDKLGGWAGWMGGNVKSHDCDVCKQPMEYVLQIASDENLPVQWGDLGTAWVFRCAAHDRWMIMWGCN